MEVRALLSMTSRCAGYATVPEGTENPGVAATWARWRCGWRTSATLGWQPYAVQSFRSWRGHRQEIIPFPREDGSVLFVEVVGEAS